MVSVPARELRGRRGMACTDLGAEISGGHQTHVASALVRAQLVPAGDDAASVAAGRSVDSVAHVQVRSGGIARRLDHWREVLAASSGFRNRRRISNGASKGKIAAASVA